MGSTAKPTTKLNATMRTDVGMVRDHNEDSAFVDPDHRFFVVADGMGGHAAGEVASAMAVDEVRKALGEAKEALDSFAAAPTDTGRRTVVGILEGSVRAAHQAVYQRGTKESDKQGMGTTLDVVVVTGPEAFVAHVGDSRTYLIRDGKAAQITTDHTVAEVLVIEGKLSVEEAQTSPLRTILVNAVGVSADVGVEMAHVRLRQNDKLLLCSDGLHDYFPVDQELADELSTKDADEALRELVELAKQRGGHDNITGVVVEVLECPPAIEHVEGRGEGVPGEVSSVDTMPHELGDPDQTADDDTLDPDEDRVLYPRPPPADTPKPAPAPAGAGGDGKERSTEPTKAAVAGGDDEDTPDVNAPQVNPKSPA